MPLVELFADDAALEFVGVPAGPFEGRAAIAAAYAAQPPTDTLTVLAVHVEDDGTVVEPFSWSADAGARSGEMRVVVAGEQIRRLVVSFVAAKRRLRSGASPRGRRPGRGSGSSA